MSLAGRVDVLNERLLELARIVDDLRLTAVEDRPAGAEQRVLDSVADMVEDLSGWVFEALAEAAAAGESVHAGSSRATALGHLYTCQSRLNRAANGGWAGLIPYETYAELVRLARDHGGEWPGWLAMLRLGLDSGREPLLAAHTALLACWYEAAAPFERSDQTPSGQNSQWRWLP